MKATAAEKRKRNEIEAVEGYQAPQTVSDMLESDKEVLAQYYTMQTDVAEEIEKWKKSAEASKLTTQRQTIAGALGGVSLLRKIAQKKNYKLTALCHKPKQLLAALLVYWSKFHIGTHTFRTSPSLLLLCSLYCFTVPH